MWFKVFWLSCLFCLSSAVQAVQVERSLLRIDHGQAATLDEALSSSLWQPVAEFGNHGFSEDVFWLKLELSLSPEEAPAARVVKMAYPVHDRVDMYQLRLGVIEQHWPMGDAREDAQWVFPAKYFAVPVVVEPGQKTTLMIRVQGHNSKVLKTEVLTEADFQSDILIRNVLSGAFYGMLLIMGLYNLSLAFLVRDKAYFVYVSYVFCFGFLALALTGDGHYVIWREHPDFNEYAIMLAGGLLAFPTIFFPYHLLNIRQNAPFLRKYFYTAAGVSLAYVCALPFMSIEVSLKLINIINIVTTLFLLGTGVFLTIKRVPVAWIYTLAWSFIISGLVVLSFAAYNVLPMNDLTTHANLLGGLIEMVLLSIALAQRIHMERRAKLQALQQVATKEAEVQEQRRLFQDLFEEAPVGVCIINDKGRLLAANPELCRLMNFKSPAEALQYDVAFRSCFSNHLELEKEVFAEGKVLDWETVLTTIDGTERICSVSLRARIRAGEVQVEGYLTDITERKAAERIRDIMERERMLSLEQLVTGVAHEINTPLGINITSASCIRDDLRTLEKQMHDGTLTKQTFSDFVAATLNATGLMEKNLNRIADLVKRFKMLSVQHLHAQKETFDLVALSRRHFESALSSVPNIQVRVHATASEVMVTMDPAVWNIIYEQLLENSLTHGFQAQANGQIWLDIQQQGSAVRVTYRDDGPGVPKDMRDTLFNPFVTTRRGHQSNAGLGLYRVYNLVTQVLKGRVKVLDEPGFVMSIEFDSEAAEPAS